MLTSVCCATDFGGLRSRIRSSGSGNEAHQHASTPHAVLALRNERPAAASLQAQVQRNSHNGRGKSRAVAEACEPVHDLGTAQPSAAVEDSPSSFAPLQASTAAAATTPPRPQLQSFGFKQAHPLHGAHADRTPQAASSATSVLMRSVTNKLPNAHESCAMPPKSDIELLDVDKMDRPVTATARARAPPPLPGSFSSPQFLYTVSLCLCRRLRLAREHSRVRHICEVT
jgi:hypothetical protein